jgi:hypothetical protein
MSDTNLSGVFVLREVRERILKDIWPKEPYIRANETYGWFMQVSRIQRIDFNSDTQISSLRAPHTVIKSSFSGEGNLNYAWITGGQLPSPALSSITSIDRYTYVSDTNSTSKRSDLLTTRSSHLMTGNDYFGWISAGRFAPGSVPGFNMLSSIERMDYRNDTNSTLNRGNCNIRIFAASVKTFEIGWFVGGQTRIPSDSILSSTDRIIYSVDTETTSTRGNLSIARFWLSATENDEYGWIAGGRTSIPSATDLSSTVDRITFASDTSIASVRGPLTNSVNQLGACSNNDYGWFGGGFLPSVNSRVERIDFKSDTGIASIRGPLEFPYSIESALEGII